MDKCILLFVTSRPTIFTNIINNLHNTFDDQDMIIVVPRHLL